MGEFTTRTRFSNPVSTAYGSSYRNAEYIYSWRSRLSKFDVGDLGTGNTAGIRAPRQSGNLLDVIVDRKRYNEDIAKTLGGMGVSSSSVSGRSVDCSTDTGHRFTSVKYGSVQEGHTTRRVRSTGMVLPTDTVFALGGAYRPPEISSTPGFPTQPGTAYAPSVAARNARLNPVFAEMQPNKEIAQIGETIVSLLRGDIPTLFKRIEKWFYNPSLKGGSKLAGSEYLNNVFGWTPMIRDFENAIRVLTVVDHLLYGSTYRRHRVVPWETSTVQSYLSDLTTAYPAAGTVASSNGLRDVSSRTIQSTYDIRLSARLVPLARPGLGANAYIDRAEEVLTQLGVWYPALGWDLLPYSWLVDWFTSLGSAITNAARYGNTPGMVKIDYCWATSCLRVLAHGGFSRQGWVREGAYDRLSVGHPRAWSIAKTRYPATPFGFGLDLSGLNASQVTILVALGLAKRP